MDQWHIFKSEKCIFMILQETARHMVATYRLFVRQSDGLSNYINRIETAGSYSE